MSSGFGHGELRAAAELRPKLVFVVWCRGHAVWGVLVAFTQGRFFPMRLRPALNVAPTKLMNTLRGDGAALFTEKHGGNFLPRPAPLALFTDEIHEGVQAGCEKPDRPPERLRLTSPSSLMTFGFITAKFRAFHTKAVSAYAAD